MVSSTERRLASTSVRFRRCRSVSSDFRFTLPRGPTEVTTPTTSTRPLRPRKDASLSKATGSRRDCILLVSTASTHSSTEEDRFSVIM